jgi:hypothetical protein
MTAETLYRFWPTEASQYAGTTRTWHRDREQWYFGFMLMLMINLCLMARGLVDTAGLKLTGGMHGAKWSARLSDCFEMERPSWAEWLREGKM